MPIVARGRWLYDGTTPCVVEIARSQIRFGSGDDEDEPDVRDDRHGETFYVWYRYANGNPLSSGGTFANIGAAKAHVEQLLAQPIEWKDSGGDGAPSVVM